MQHLQTLTLFCRLTLTLIAILIGVFFLTYSPSQWKINSSLKSLSPDFVNDEGVQRALTKLSNSIEQQFVLLVISDSADVAEAAHDQLRDLIDESAPYLVSDPLENIDEYLALMQEHRFHLMTMQQSHWLNNASYKEVINYAKSRIYGLEGSAQALPLNDDPFGFASNFIASSGDESISADEATQFTYEGKTLYHLPIVFKIKGDALNIETQDTVLQELSLLKDTVTSRFPGVNFLHSGIIFFAADAAKKSKRDISVIGLGSTIGIIILLLVVFRSLTPLGLPLLSVLFGVTFAFVCTQQLYGGIHILTIVFGASLIGVAIDYALHYFFHKTSCELSTQSSHLYRALTFSLLTSIIGYAALALSGLESLKHIAVFSVLGLFGAWLTVLSIGPIFIRHCRRRSSPLLNALASSLLSAFSKLPLTSFSIIGISILGIFSVIFFTGLTTSDDPRVFFKPDPRILSEEKFVGEEISSYEPGTFVLLRGNSSEEIFEAISRITKRIGEQQASLLLGPHRFLPSEAQQENYYRQYQSLFAEDGRGKDILMQLGMTETSRIKLRRELQDQKGRLLTAQKLFGTLGKNTAALWVEDNGSIYSFLLIPREFDKPSLAMIAKGETDIFFINSAELARDAIRGQREAAFVLLLCALLFLSVLIILRHRALRFLNLVLVPTSAIALTLSVFQLASVPVTLFHMMALFLVLGLGMDYVIFVSEITEANNPTLQAILLSAITSLLSFGLLSLSEIPVVKAFGSTVLIGNSINFLGACALAGKLHFAPREVAINVGVASER